jgi:hypothetical protein
MAEHRSKRDEMRSEYDFSGGVRGKYAARYAKGTNLVLLDPDLADVFPDAESVNRTLRPIAEMVRARAKAASAGGRRS